MQPWNHYFIIQIFSSEKPIFYKWWYENTIFVVSDILNENGSFIDFHTLNLTYGMKAHFLEYNGLLASVKDWIKNKQYFGKDM